MLEKKHPQRQIQRCLEPVQTSPNMVRQIAYLTAFLRTLFVSKIEVFGKMFSIHLNQFLSGPLSIGIPGELMGYYEAHKRFGRLPFAKIVEPSIILCEKGYEMSKHQAMSLTFNDISNDTNLR